MEAESDKSTNVVVPKFASFRPKPPIVSVHDVLQGDASNIDIQSRVDLKGAGTQDEASPTKERKHSHHHNKRRSRSGERRKHHRHHRSRSREPEQSRAPKVRPFEPAVIAWDEGPEIYTIDRKGDPSNLTYGTIHRYNIPPYYRSGAGGVIGAAAECKIDRSISKDSVLVIGSRDGRPSLPREKYAFAKNERKGIKKLRIRPVEEQIPSLEEVRDYIPLRTLQGKKRKCELYGSHSPSSSSAEDNHHYRSIQGKAKAKHEPTDPDFEFASNPSASDDEDAQLLDLSQETRQRGMDLSRKVELQPTNVEAWLDLIDHQDNLLSFGGGSDSRELTNAERRSTADIKLSMFTRALERVGSRQEGREVLLLGMMDEGSKIWEAKKLSNEWERVLRGNPSFIRLWTRYLNFQQTNFVPFRHEQCRCSYAECLDVLKVAASASQGNMNLRDRLGDIAVYVLLRLTLFLREGGFMEHSIAIWQALLEMNFFKKADVKQQSNTNTFVVDAQLMSSFEEFWESEVPRIGETGAKGWLNHVNGEGTGPEPTADSSDFDFKDHENIFESWIEEETIRTLRSRRPARTIDEVEEDDPYRVILFSDIKDFLIQIPSLSGQSTLLNAFFAYCRLPPLSSMNQSAQAQTWWRDSFIRNEVLEQCGPSYYRWLKDTHVQESSAPHLPWLAGMELEQPNLIVEKGPFDSILSDFITSTETLFPTTEQWFETFNTKDTTSSRDVGPLDIEWIMQCLKSLLLVNAGGDEMAEYYLALENWKFPQSAKKVAKALLKKRPSSLRLWNAYALIESALRNPSAATHVFITAINMSKTLPQHEQHDSILLWRTWIWEFLRVGNHRTALYLLLSTPSDTLPTNLLGGESPELDAVSPTALLKASRHLLDSRDTMLPRGHLYHAMLYAECLALLTYLSTSLSITAALSIYHSASSALLSLHTPTSTNTNSSPYASALSTAKTTAHTLLHQSRARLLHHHVTHTRLNPPSLLRNCLAESVRLFPSNTIFLSLYAWNEARSSRVDDRVRAIMREVVLTNATSPKESWKGQGKEGEEEGEGGSVVPWFFAIQAEMQRAAGAGANKHSIRAVFERAVGSTSGRCSAALWTLYVLFTLQYAPLPTSRKLGQQRPRWQEQSPKEVFHRGMRHLPWHKPYLLLPFTTPALGLMFSFEELRGLYNILGEKELRVHVDLEEVFDRLDNEDRPKADQTRGSKARLPLRMPDDGSGSYDDAG
ncbi:MAG: hypothetical protein M1827_003341 [Pycnora praestabilis]|nr:MAG: hypothetical protein M1827_003341 [Pycnora praestabilis]